jgi:hypothetical protein
MREQSSTYLFEEIRKDFNAVVLRGLDPRARRYLLEHHRNEVFRIRDQVMQQKGLPPGQSPQDYLGYTTDEEKLRKAFPES